MQNTSSVCGGDRRKIDLLTFQVDKSKSNCHRFKLGVNDNYVNLLFTGVFLCMRVHSFIFLQDFGPVVRVSAFGCVCVCVFQCVCSPADDSRRAVLSAGRKRGGGGVCYFTRLP